MHRELALEAVRKSEIGIPQKILVAGTHADDLGCQCGGWTFNWTGSSGRITIGTAILDAIKETVGDKTEVVYEKNPSPDTFTGQDFSFATVAVGESPYVEGSGDDPELIIPFTVKCEYNGTELISSIADRVPTLAILISGRPLTLKPKLLEKIDGLVAAWLPGSEGGGITIVVFGDYEFRGRLPVTWFKSVEQLPMHVGENSYDPLFPLSFPEAKQKMLLHQQVLNRRGLRDKHRHISSIHGYTQLCK
ncbi:unnamed protein product [Camellia sinensis]